MDFSEVFTKAAKIVWKHKVLWLFGLLAGCTARSGGGGNFNYNMNDRDFGNGNVPPFLRDLGQMFENIPAWVYVLIAFGVLLLMIIALYLGTMGRIGLVRGTVQADGGAQKLSLSELWQGSQPFFWRVFWLNVLVFVVVLVVLLILLVPGILLTAVTMGIGAICLIPLICVFAIAGWVLNVVVEQAVVAIVTENLGVVASLQRAWQVVRANLGAEVVVALIIGVGGGILSFLIAVPFIFTMLPLIIGAVGQSNTAITSGIAISVVLALLYLPIALLIGSILQAYISAVWTLTYLRLSGKSRPQSGVLFNPPPAAPLEPPSAISPVEGSDI